MILAGGEGGFGCLVEAAGIAIIEDLGWSAMEFVAKQATMKGATTIKSIKQQVTARIATFITEEQVEISPLVKAAAK